MASNSPSARVRAAASLSASPSRTASPKNVRNLVRRNHRGETQLHLAAQRGDVALAARAIESGVDVNGADHAGWTPLHEACASGQYTVVEMLISNGADVNRLSSDNTSPLHDAIQYGDARLVWLLLRHGAAVDEEARTMAKSDEIHRLLNMEDLPVEYPYDEEPGDDDKQQGVAGEGRLASGSPLILFVSWFQNLPLALRLPLRRRQKRRRLMLHVIRGSPTASWTPPRAAAMLIAH